MTPMTPVTIRRPDDLHVHLREGDMLKRVAPYTAELFGRALIMPNTSKPIVTAEDVNRYRGEILQATQKHRFQPLMTIKLLDRTTPQIVREAKLAGAVAGKLYPAGVTTNSDDGVRYIQSLYDTFEVMQEVGMVLSLHGEAPEAFCLDREEAFLGILKDIAKTFPRLRIVLEHVTTNAAVETVQALPETVAATITAHHLVLTLDDVVGGKINPHNFCKPLAKRPADRSALIEAAFSYSPKFFFGTDSAPHIRETKECAAGCAGCFTAPLALELLAHVADEHGLSLEGIQGFTSEYGAQFYGLPLNEGMVTFVREPWTVPDVLDGVVPFWAGQTLNWRCKFLHGGPFYSA